MFNEKQLEAINTLNGRIRVIAGAGSGKTSVLTHRYAELVKQGVNAASILCVTFTNKAANEMKERIVNLIGDGIYPISTFHSFCLNVLRQHITLLGYPNNFVILDSEDQTSILKKVYKDNKINYEEISYASAKDIISERKTITEDNLIDVLSKDNTIQTLYNKYKKIWKEDKDVCPDYNKLLKDVIYYGYLYYQQKSTGIDFNDMIILTVYLFKNFKDVLEQYQARIKYVMVDEFQDASTRQYELVSMLTEKSNNLFVVGDPDQTIYSWRGAKPEILVNFDKDKPTKTIIMNQNYRSTPNILKVANDIISKNTLRVEKDLFTENPEGKKVWFRHFENIKQEASWIVDSIEAALKIYKPNEIAVLYRMHFLSRSVEEQLIKRRIPYIIHSGVNFYERKEIKDILTYLKLIINVHDDLAFERIINVPTRGIGKKKLEEIKSYANEKLLSYWDATQQIIRQKGNAKLEDFILLISYLKQSSKNMNLLDLVEDIIDKTGYGELLQNSLEPEREQNVKELLASIEDLDSKTKLEEYLQEITLLTNIDKKNNNSCVTLMTVHSAKGLEFPVVYVTGMSEGLFPSAKATSIEQQEEERRLAYVAYTRAKERLILTDTDGKDFNGNQKETSRFITEINKEDIDSNITMPIHTYKPQKLYSTTMYTGDHIAECFSQTYTRTKNNYGGHNCHGQYFDSDGKYYDWDDDTYLQGSIGAEDIFDAGDFC